MKFKRPPGVAVIWREAADRDPTHPSRLSSRIESVLGELLKGNVQTVCLALFCETCNDSHRLLYPFMYSDDQKVIRR